MTSHDTRGPVTTLHDDYRGVLGRPLDNFFFLPFGLSQFHGHGSWLVWEVALGPQCHVGDLGFMSCGMTWLAGSLGATCFHIIVLHWVPMSTYSHGFWVGMGVILLFMCGHGWASVLCIRASISKSESNFSDAGNMLTKKRSGLKPVTMNDLISVRSNQDLV
jgi:hypothetical protein